MKRLRERFNKLHNQPTGSATLKLSKTDQLILEVFGQIDACNAALTFDVTNKFVGMSFKIVIVNDIFMPFLKVSGIPKRGWAHYMGGCVVRLLLV